MCGDDVEAFDRVSVMEMSVAMDVYPCVRDSERLGTSCHVKQIVHDHRKKVSGRFRGKFGQYRHQNVQQKSAARIRRGFPWGIARKSGETSRDGFSRCRGNAALPSVSMTVALCQEGRKGLIILENRDDDRVAAYLRVSGKRRPTVLLPPPDA